MAIAILTLNYVLPALGIYQLITSTVKITKRYPLRRWFF